MEAPSRPLVIVANPRSGAERSLHALQALARNAGAACELLVVRRRGELRTRVAQARAAAERRGGVLVAAGGDGTINAVAQAAHDADLAFGVLPRGTFNYFARLHRLPLELDAAWRVLRTGHVAPVQVGRVNRRLFLVNASLGLYPRLLEEREQLKRRWGRSRAVAFAAGLVTLLREQRRLTLAVDRLDDADPPRVLQTSTLFVGNNALQLEQVGVAAARAVPHGRLAAVSVRPAGRLEMLGVALHGALGRLGDAEHVDDFAFRAMTVAPAGRVGLPVVQVAADGETAWMRWPLHFEVAERPLRLVVPPPEAAPP